MAKTEDNVKWPEEIHVLFNELATDQSASRPDAVLGVLVFLDQDSWNKKRSREGPPC